MGLRDANASNDRRYNWTKMFGTIARNENGDPTDPCAGDSGDFIFAGRSISEHKITASDANQTPIQSRRSSRLEKSGFPFCSCWDCTRRWLRLQVLALPKNCLATQFFRFGAKIPIKENRKILIRFYLNILEILILMV